MIESKKTLVLGGASSGKSLYAEELAFSCKGAERHYVATAWSDSSGDNEMSDKVKVHQNRRILQGGWTTHEVRSDLAEMLSKIDQPGRVILVDCLTLWLSGSIFEEKVINFKFLSDVISQLHCSVICVSNELGLGLVPETKQARDFRNLHGQMNQVLAKSMDRVVFVAAGLPMVLK